MGNRTEITTGMTGLQFRNAINNNDEYLFYRDDYISVKEFGAVGDGVIDDSESLQTAFDFARDNNYNILLEKDKTYLLGSSVLALYFYGGILEGNGATIKCTHAADTLSWGIVCNGALGDAYSLDGRGGIIGNNRIDISDETFLANISIGDMIIISSDKAYFPGDLTSKQGESAVVVDIGVDYIILEGKLNDTYLPSDNAVVRIVTSYSPVIRNINILQNKDKSIDYYSYGISISYCKNPIIDNCNVQWAKFKAYNINSCYAPVVRNCKSSMTVKDGLGYGVSYIGANTNPITIGCILKSARHAVAHGGSIYGVTHNSIVSDTYGEAHRSTHVFDAHGPTGKVTWSNCIAVGGIIPDEELDSNIKGEWSVSTEYNIGEVVSKDNILWELVTASSIGENPITSTDWKYYNNGSSGFSTRSNNQSILNCTVINCSNGIYGIGYATVIDGFYVDGLRIINGNRGIIISSGTELTNAYFNNVSLENTYFKTQPYLLYIDDATFTNVEFGKLSAKNCRGIYMKTFAGNLNIDKLSSKDQFLLMGSACVSARININTVNIIGNSSEYLAYVNDIESLNINDYNAIDINVNALVINGSVGNVSINNIQAKGSGSLMTHFARLFTGSTITNLSFGITNIKADTTIDLIRNDGTITNSYLQYVSGDVTEDYDSTFTLPVVEYIGYMLKP